MPIAKDLSGQRFGRLVAIKYLYTKYTGQKVKQPHRMWLCRCDCGGTKIASSGDLLRLHTTSCGCKLSELAVSLSNNPRTTHGMSNTRLYQCYRKMLRRCTHEKNWKDKGITVCDEWRLNPQSFLDWAINNGYSDELTLDRIDVYGNYCPENCRWATMFEQAQNKTTSRKITIGGITHTLSEWSRISGVKSATISKRIEHGYPEEEWLIPVYTVYHTEDCTDKRGSHFRYITINGVTNTLSEWEKISGLSRRTISARIKRGWSESDLLLPVGTQRSRILSE